MRPLLVLAMLALTGCTTYVLRTGDPDTQPPEEDWDDTAVWGQTCPDTSFEGYEVRGSPGCEQDTDTGTALLPDLTLAPAGRCEVDCPDDRVVLWVHPGNRGKTDITGATLTVYLLQEGERSEVMSQEVSGTLRQGWMEESVQVDLLGFDIEDADAAILRLHSQVPDCDDTNDELNVLGPFCD